MKKQTLTRAFSFMLAMFLLFSVSVPLTTAVGAASAATFSFIEASEHGALADDQKIVLISAESNDTTYTLGGDYNKSLYYSARYGGYVAIVDADATADSLAKILTSKSAAANEINHEGDVNGDGRVTAGDAALISRILHSYSAGSTAAKGKKITDMMRLSADVCNNFKTSGVYVSLDDAYGALYSAVGLTYENNEVEGTYTKFPLYSLADATENLYIYNNSYISKGNDGSFYSTTYDLGEYRFNDDQQALQVMQSGTSDYRFWVATKKKNLLKEDETYMVILYRTNVESAGSVTFINGYGKRDNVTLVSDMSVSADKWVYSSPVYINGFTDYENLFARLCNGNDLGSRIIVDMPIEGDSDYVDGQYFFIKEILFFSSEAYAEQYAKTVPAPEATEVIFGSGLSKDQWIDPVAISFDSAEKTALNAVVYDGELAYTDDGAKASGSFAPAFKSEGYLLENHMLVSLSYRTEGAGTITLGNTVIATDTSVSAGEWVYTKPVELTKEMRAALISYDPYAITYTGSGDLYVGELVFVSGLAQISEYESEFDSMATGTYLDGKLGEFTVLSAFSGDEMGKWSYDEDTAFTLDYTDPVYDSSYRMAYRFVNRNEILTKTGSTIEDRELDYFYMRATYKADNGSGDGVKLITVNPVSGVAATLDSEVQNTNGEWVLSAPVRVPNDILNVLSGNDEYFVNQYEELFHQPAVLAFTNTKSDASYAVKNIYFFKTAEDAINFTMPAEAAKPVSTYKIGSTTFNSVTPVSAVDGTMAADSYKIYVDGTTLKVDAGSADTLAVANKVAEGRVLAGDTYKDVVSVTLASDFSLTGKASSAAATETVALKYDDRHTFDKEVAYVDSTSITSTDAFTGEADVSVLKRISGETFAASATGEATVYFTDGTSVKVTVETAPLAVFMIGGQSNGEGVDGDPKTSIRNAPGQVYSSYAPAGYRYIEWILSKNYKAGIDVLTVHNSDVFIPRTLTGTESRVGAQLSYTPDWLTEGGYGKAGIDSSVAYEWNRQTGDKVWTINVAHSGSGIKSWQPGTGANFMEAVGVMKSAEETLKAEIAAGHYYLTNMGYYWVQGCSDIDKTVEFYNDGFHNMHNGFVKELAFDHDSNPETPDRTVEFGGIILVRVGFANDKQSNNAAVDFAMNAPRTAQYLLGNTPNDNIYMVSNVGEIFRDDASVTSYFKTKYGTDANFKALTGASYSLPTKIAYVHPDIHYRQQGYNEIGREAAYNLLHITGRVTYEATDVTFKLLDKDGVAADFATSGVTIASGATVKIVPDVAPRYMATDVSVTTSSNVTHDGYYVFKSTDGKAGTITFTCGGSSVTVKVN